MVGLGPLTTEGAVFGIEWWHGPFAPDVARLAGHWLRLVLGEKFHGLRRLDDQGARAGYLQL